MSECLFSTLPILHGVSQGSVLGPILFIVFIIELSRYLSRDSCIIYANDITNKGSVSDLEDARVSEWFSFNKLAINVNET